MKTKMAKEAFELQDWITGTETGGIEAPRQIINIEELKDGSVAIIWQNPETCGLSDCRYHNIDTIPHVSVYKLVKKRLFLNGDPEFVKWVCKNCREYVLEFCNKYQLEMPDEATALPWTACEDVLPTENDQYMVAWFPAEAGFKKAFYEICEFSDGEWLTDTII